MATEKEIKCVVWDLDETIWDGVLLETNDVKLKPNIPEILETLDKRGILCSISSKNDYFAAMAKLREFKIDQYFLYPEINWGIKSKSIDNIRKNLNLGIDTFLFVDDQPFEREEVKSVHKEIRCLSSVKYPDFLNLPILNPRFITIDSAKRRRMYQEDILRKRFEFDFEGPSKKFLASLNMEFVISNVGKDDLKRVEELTVRTNQLNATGVTYNYETLDAYRRSDDHLQLICELSDKFGSYGKIGLALIETSDMTWHIRLLLMSCRVMSRGVGTVLLQYIMSEAKSKNKKLLADFKKTERNRMMYVSYKFANFKEISKTPDGLIVLENDLSQIQDFPPYINVKINQ